MVTKRPRWHRSSKDHRVCGVMEMNDKPVSRAYAYVIAFLVGRIVAVVLKKKLDRIEARVYGVRKDAGR